MSSSRDVRPPHRADPAIADCRLVDAGRGRRLDRFGPWLVDRPHPAAAFEPADPAAWDATDARFDRRDDGPIRHGGWTVRPGRSIEPWLVREADLVVELRLGSGGGVGWYPEQAEDRRWIGTAVGRLLAIGDGDVAILNLFGHTGGATLAAARAGARVTHVDAARATVAWARHNAALNGLAEHPIRWIADDAAAFVRRELRRGRRYAGVVLDPPTYGHGPDGRDWRIERDLPNLLDDVAALTLPMSGAFLVLGAHATGIAAGQLEATLRRALSSMPDDRSSAGSHDELAAEDVAAVAESGVRLPLGARVRWRRADR